MLGRIGLRTIPIRQIILHKLRPHTGILSLPPSRGAKLNAPTLSVEKISLWSRLQQFFGLKSQRLQRYKASVLETSGTNMYLICSEFPVYSEFISQLDLPDTFESWFNITALHIWLVLVRLRPEGSDAGIPKTKIFEYITGTDLKSRSRGFNSPDKYNHLKQFQQQLYAQIIAYDEGLLSGNDRVLAGGIWRSFFNRRVDINAEHLELMVQYIHRQLKHLDSISSEQILGKGIITFLPFIEERLVSNETFFNERLTHTFKRPDNL